MSKTRVLLVDDDAVTRRVVVSCLRGCTLLEVATCDSGQQALERLRSGAPIDCLLLDWNMPGLTGYEVLRALRADSRFNAVRVLMLTTETSLEHVRQALAAGANEYLMKPFSKQTLLSKLALLDFNLTCHE